MYIHQSVSIDKVLHLLKQLQQVGTEVHQFAMYQNGQKILEFAPAPYSVTDKRRVNSVSKSFISTAIGLCYDRGLLKPDDKLVSFFSEQLTRDADEKIKRLTLHDLLTMCTSVEDVMPLLVQSDNVLETFFSHKFQFTKEGFKYNNSATFMLSAVITQLTGGTALDFLQKELFPVLGITGVSWPSLCGITEGCAGLRISADDLARHMQVYLEGGTYHGKRILSREWVEMATKLQITNHDDNGMEWWNKGYCYQFWRNKADGYRATGSLGQYGDVFPSLNVVLGVESRVRKDDATQDIYHRFCSDYTGDSKATRKELEDYLEHMYTPLGNDVSLFGGFGHLYVLEPNDLGFTQLCLYQKDDTVECEFSEGEFIQTMSFGIGKWQENRIFVHNFRPELYHLTIPRREIVHFAASCVARGTNLLEVMIRFRDCAFGYKMMINATEKIEIKFDTTYLTSGAICVKGMRYDHL